MSEEPVADNPVPLHSEGPVARNYIVNLRIPDAVEITDEVVQQVIRQALTDLFQGMLSRGAVIVTVDKETRQVKVSCMVAPTPVTETTDAPQV